MTDTRFHLRTGMAWPKDVLFRKYLEIASVVSAYWVISISLVFINKHLLSGTDLKLDAPFFITWFQCLVTVILCISLTFVSYLTHKCFKREIFSFSTFGVSLDELRQVLPASLVFVAMMSFNNLCLKYVDVSFYYIVRSLTTVFNVILSYVMLHQKTSCPALMCCGVIIGGFLLGVDQEKVAGSLSSTGVIFGVLASLFVALNSICVKKILNVVRGDVSLLTYYNNINACFLFPPLIFFLGEGQNLWMFQNYGTISFWAPMLMGGIFGFAIGYLINLQVKVTSPLTNNISGTAKACAQTILASAIYHETRSLLWWVSNMVVLAGSAAYTRVKQLEMIASNKRQIIGADLESQKQLLISEDEQPQPKST